MHFLAYVHKKTTRQSKKNLHTLLICAEKERKFEVLEDATNLIKLDEIPLQEKK